MTYSPKTKSFFFYLRVPFMDVCVPEGQATLKQIIVFMCVCLSAHTHENSGVNNHAIKKIENRMFALALGMAFYLKCICGLYCWKR